MDTQEARIYIAIIIASILLGVIFLFFIVTMIRQQRRHLALQRAFLRAELDAIEVERARIAADLHDDLAPVLTVARFQVDHAIRVSPSPPKELIEASRQLDEIVNRMREIANDLMPIALQRKGIVIAIQEFIEQLKGPGRPTINFNHEGLSLLDENKVVHCFRIIQELLHNCIKHAGASSVTLLLKVTPGLFTLHYHDNGKGFNAEQVLEKGDGIGLRSLRSRAEILEGRMKVESKPEAGTAFFFEIPL